MEKLGIAIIGGGPAGLAAGIYAARGGASVKLFEEMFPGGQIVKTHRVENYPGLTGGPDGYAWRRPAKSRRRSSISPWFTGPSTI